MGAVKERAATIGSAMAGKKRRREEDVEAALELLRRKEVKVLQQQHELAKNFLRSLPGAEGDDQTKELKTGHAARSQGDSFVLSLRISASDVALLRAIVEWGCGAVAIAPENAGLWATLTTAAQNLARCTGWGVLPAKLGGKALAAAEKAVRQCDDPVALESLAVIVRVFASKLGFRPDFNALVSLTAACGQRLADAPPAVLDPASKLLQQTSVPLLEQASAQTSKKLFDVAVKKLFGPMAAARARLVPRPRVALFPLPTVASGQSVEEGEPDAAEADPASEACKSGLQTIDLILQRTLFHDEAVEQFDAACLSWQGDEASKRAKRMVSYVTSLFVALRNGAAMGDKPLCDLVPVLTAIFLERRDKLAGEAQKKSRKLTSEMKFCIEMLHTAAEGQAFASAILSCAATLRVMLDKHVFEISRVSDTEQLERWFTASLMRPWKSAGTDPSDPHKSAAQVHVVALILEADHRIVHAQLHDVLHLAFAMSRRTTQEATPLPPAEYLAPLAYAPGTELVIRLVDTYSRLRQMPSFLSLYMAAMEADPTLALEALRGDVNVEAGLGSTFSRTPPGQNAQVWGALADALERSRDQEGSADATLCIATLFTWFMRYVTVSEFSAQEFAGLASGLSQSFDHAALASAVTGFVVADLIVFDALEALEHLCAAWRFSEESNRENDRGVSTAAVNAEERGPELASGAKLCRAALKFERALAHKGSEAAASQLLRRVADRSLCRLALASLRDPSLDKASREHVLQIVSGRARDQVEVILEHLSLLDAADTFRPVICEVLRTILQARDLEPLLRASFYELRLTRGCFVDVLADLIETEREAGVMDFYTGVVAALPEGYLLEDHAQKLLGSAVAPNAVVPLRAAPLYMAAALVEQRPVLCREQSVQTTVKALLAPASPPRASSSEGADAERAMLALLRAWAAACLRTGAAEDFARLTRAALAAEAPQQEVKLATLLQSCVTFYEERPAGGKASPRPPATVQALQLPLLGSSLLLQTVAVDFHAVVVRKPFDAKVAKALVGQLGQLVRADRTLRSSEEASFVAAMYRTARLCQPGKSAAFPSAETLLLALLRSSSDEKIGAADAVAEMFARAESAKELPRLLKVLSATFAKDAAAAPLVLHVLPVVTKSSSERHGVFDRTVGGAVLSSLMRHCAQPVRSEHKRACMKAMQELLLYSPNLWHTSRLQNTRAALNVVARTASEAGRDGALLVASCELFFSLVKSHSPSISRKCPALAMSALQACCDGVFALHNNEGSSPSGQTADALQAVLRACEALSSHKTIFRHYAVFWLAVYLGERPNWSTGVELDAKSKENLQLIAFVWFDLCTTDEVQQLHSLLGEGGREHLKTLREDYRRKHKYKGQV